MFKAAGDEHNGFLLSGALSPLSPNAVHLVMSVTCVRNTDVSGSWFHNQAEGCTVKYGNVPSNYRVLIHDSRGNRVATTNFGKEFFERHYEEIPRNVSLHCATGTWLALDELFCLRPNEEYTVLAMVPDEAGGTTGLVSPPIKIHVPELPEPGVTRPLYGSDWLWEKLAVRALKQDSEDVMIACKSIDNPLAVGRIPEIQLQNRSGHFFGPEVELAESTVLVRDSRGEPAHALRVEDHAEDEIRRYPAAAERLKAFRQSDSSLFYRCMRRSGIIA